MFNNNYYYLSIYIYFLLYLTNLGNSQTTINSDKNHETIISSSSSGDDKLKFPDDFKFGAATASYQIEGGWNADGKGPSIWDTITHNHSNYIDDKSTGDVGPDSYHMFDKDIIALKETGVNFYRFSISWSRILPNGDTSNVNLAGLEYYSNLIDKLLANGIEPMVTMYHYDLPQKIQEQFGGLVNPVFIDFFEEYANLLFNSYANRVKTWITFNEPFDFCVEGYGQGISAPLVNATGTGEYYCVDNVLRAHAKVYHLYKKSYFDDYPAKIGITLSSRFYYAKAGAPTDVDIVDRAMQFQLGWLAHPIFSTPGNYPAIMIQTINSNSIHEGHLKSRLPEICEKWKPLIKGSADFLGLNYYTSRIVELDEKWPTNKPVGWEADARLRETVNETWPKSKSSWLYSVPNGLGDILRWIKEEYNNVEVIITENGWSDNGELEDNGRVKYIQDHLKEVVKAVVVDKCNVTGYAVWSIIDNFEWLRGYTEKFGLYRVDVTSTEKIRVAKKSAGIYKKIIQTLEIPIENNIIP